MQDGSICVSLLEAAYKEMVLSTRLYIIRVQEKRYFRPRDTESWPMTLIF